MLDKEGYRHSLGIFNASCFCTATVTRKRLIVTLNVQYIVCIVFVACCAGRGLSGGQINRPEESYRVQYVCVQTQQNPSTLAVKYAEVVND